MNKELLPIGTVVLLKEATKEIMITGYMPSTEEGEEYDYTACLYPEGLLALDEIATFNHDSIDKILFKGYTNDNTKAFLRKLDAYNKQHSKKTK